LFGFLFFVQKLIRRRSRLLIATRFLSLSTYLHHVVSQGDNGEQEEPGLRGPFLSHTLPPGEPAGPHVMAADNGGGGA